MSFKHYEKSRVEYHDTALWTPSAWDRSCGVPPIKLRLERPGASSARYLKAMTTKKNRFPVRGKDELATPEFARKNKNATLNLIIMGLVCGWEDVYEDGSDTIMPFPEISHDNPKAPGNKLVRELLAALGPDMEAELCAWVNFEWNWRVRPAKPDVEEEDDEDDEDEDDEEDVSGPLDGPSPTE